MSSSVVSHRFKTARFAGAAGPPLASVFHRKTRRPAAPTDARAAWVDVAKAFCIVLIVMMHSTLGYQAAVGSVGFLDPVVAFFAPFRVPALFVLSGLYIASAMRAGTGMFLRRRIAPLAYFYVLWATIQLVLKEHALLLADPVSFAARFGMVLVEPYGALWFIHVLALCSVAVFALRWVDKRIVVIGALLLNVLTLTTGWTAIDEFSARFIFFVAGWVFFGRIHSLAAWAKTRPLLSLSLVGLFAFANALLLSWSLRPEHPLLALSLSAAGAAALIAASVHVAGHPTAGPLMAALGRRTLPIYLAFFLPMAAMRAVMIAMHPHLPLLTVGLATLLITVVAVVVPLVVHAFVVRTPLAFLFTPPWHTSVDGSSPPTRRPMSAQDSSRVIHP
jgi:uncharacterized membrane protein YcfT